VNVGPRLRFCLAPDPAHLLRARERLRAYLSGYCAETRTVHDLVLAIEEACTNAIRHSGSQAEIEIALSFDDGHVIATVKDQGRGFDVAAFERDRVPDPTLDHGRGLFLISRLCDEVALTSDGGCEVRLVKRDAVAAPGAAAAFDPSGQPTFLEEIDELFAAVDWEFRYLYVNRRFCEMTGKARNELLGRTLWELFPEVVGTDVERRLLDAMHLGVASRYEFWFPPLQSWFEQRLYPTAYGINQFSVEISERKRRESDRDDLLARLRDSEERYRTIVETAAEGVVIARPDGAYTYVNRRMVEMLGRPIEEILGRMSVDLASREWRGDVEAPRRQLGSGKVVSGEFAFLRGDGTTLWTRFNASPLHDKSGRHVANVVLHTDIAAEKAAAAEREALLERSQMQTRELEAQSEALRAQGQELRAQGEAVRAQGEELRSQADELRAQTEELAERVRLSEALNAINRLVHATFTADQIMQRALDAGVRALRLDAGAIEMRAPGGWLVRYQYGLDPAATGALLPDEIAPNAVRAEQTRSLFAIADMRDSAVDVGFVREYGLQSVLAVPLLAREQVTGCLLAYGKTPRTFSPGETDFGRKLGATITLALENARLLEAEIALREGEERRTRELQVLRRVAESASSSLDVTTAARAVVDEVRRLLDADQVQVRLVDVNGRSLEPVATFDPTGRLQLEGAMPVRADRETAICFRTGRPRAGADAQVGEVTRASLRAARKTDVHAFAVLPLRTGGNPIGTLFAAWNRVRQVAPDELAMLETIAAAATTGLENARLFETQRDIATALQAHLIHPMPRVEGLELAAVSRPANRPDLVGGDFHDVLIARKGLVALLIGDVAGKGIAAAGMTETVRSAMRVLALITPSPEYVLRHVNDLLMHEPGHGQLVTALLVVVDLAREQAMLASAGHPPPVLVRRGASAELLELPYHPPLGAFATSFGARQFPLVAGDTLLLYTDGVTEARHGREMFGEQRLLAAVDELRDGAVRDVAQGVGAAVERYADELRDDVQILVVRRGG
jgi:PAS domain S-box-containing protein